MRDASVYIHFPWCLKKCPYCDFATRKIAPEDVPHEAYADAIVRELHERRAGFDGFRLISVFFGGGTPSLWATPALGRVLREVRAAFGSEAPDVEITAECNPSSLDEAKVHGMAEAGINRVSIGVQSLDDGRLQYLGRAHDREGALRACRAAAKVMPRMSADLMFGMPGQTVPDLIADVDALLEVGVRHLSAYALTIEPGTQFGELHKKGKLLVAPDEDYAAMFMGAESHLAERGFEHYEVSNYAHPGEASRHNLHYWRGGTYFGLGAAAVGCLHGETGAARRWRNHPDAAKYMAAEATAAREESSEPLGPTEIIREALMLGLRTHEGMDVAKTEARAGRAPFLGRESALERRLSRGDVTLDAGILRVPHHKWLHLDGIVADLF